MKKHFIFALIVAIIMSNCFSTTALAREIGSPPGEMEILAEAPDEIIEEAAVPDTVIEGAEVPNAGVEDETPDTAVEQAAAADDVIEEAEVPNADIEAIPASEEIADSEELVSAPNNSCGANATWSISGSVLKISGSGAMYDYGNTASAPWYNRRSEITIVFVEDGITQLGGYTFRGLDNLVCVSLPTSLKKIGNGTFYQCTNLTAIEIPSGVTSIDAAAFGYCTNLINISFLGNAPVIGHMAFAQVPAAAYYRSSASGWSGSNTSAYGGYLTWTAVTKYYDVWVYGVRVNSANKNNVLNTNDIVKYNSSTKTLDLPRMTERPKGLAISRDFYEICAPVYAIGDLNLKIFDYLNMVETSVSVYVTGDLTIFDSDTRMNGVYTGQFTVRDTRANFAGINSGNIDIDNCEFYAYGLASQDHIVMKDSFIHVMDSHAYSLLTCWSCDIQNCIVKLNNSEGTAIQCYSLFKISGSYMTAHGKIAGINAPDIRILSGNEIAASGNDGAMFGVEDAMSREIEIAPGYVFIEPANPVIGPYAIKENGQNAKYVNMRQLTPEDKGGLRRGKTAVSSITMPTQSLTQLELRTKDDNFVTGTWTSGNSGIASVDKTGLVAAKKYGKTKITCKAGDTTLTCDVQTRFYDVNDPNQPGYKQIYWGVDKGIISGFNGGIYFGPDLPCTRLQFAVMMWRAKGKPKASGTLTFKDTKNLNPNTDSYKAILWASKNGIVKGYSDNTFRPDNNITRESIVIILWRMAGQPKAKKVLAFKDTKSLSKTSTAYKAVAWASEKKIVNGYTDNTFRKDDYCKRFQCIIMIYRFVNR